MKYKLYLDHTNELSGAIAAFVDDITVLVVLFVN